MKPNVDIRRAADALQRATGAREGDLDHPGHDELTAFVDGRLDDADREVVETHIELCAICAQDVADLAGVRDALRVKGSAPSSATKPFPKRMVQIAAAVVAVVGLSLLLRGQLTSDSNVVSESTPATVATAPAPVAPVAPAVQADTLTADERALVDRVLSTGKLEMPAAVRSLAGPMGTLLGSAPVISPLEPLTPIGTAVLSEKPEFTWHAMTGATSYSIAVFDEQFREVVRGEKLTGASWTPAVALPRGVTLAWQVTAHLPGRDVLAPEPPQPEARFVVVDKATETAIASQQARLSSQPLVLGVLMAKAGLFSDAAREFTRAAAQPETAERAKALLASLSK